MSHYRIRNFGECLIGLNSTAGITSRGRIGIDATLEAQALVEPYLVDPVDRETFITAVTNLAANLKKGTILIQPFLPFD